MNKKATKTLGLILQVFLYSDQKNLQRFLGPRKSIDFRGNQGFSGYLFYLNSGSIK